MIKNKTFPKVFYSGVVVSIVCGGYEIYCMHSVRANDVRPLVGACDFGWESLSHLVPHRLKLCMEVVCIILLHDIGWSFSVPYIFCYDIHNGN